MTLSNTAVPKYYGMFRESVIHGDIPVNEQIALQMERVDARIANPSLYYDDSAVEGFIKFCENEMCLADGADIYLMDTFKLWAEDLLSWFYFIERSVYIPNKDNHGGHYEKKIIKKRLVNVQYLIVGRGAAKTMYAAFIHMYFLTVDTSTTRQIITAPTMRQAEETIRVMKTAINRAKGPLFKFLTSGSKQNTTGSKIDRIKLASTKKGIENFYTNSIVEIVPMSIDKLQGAGPKVAIVDEWLSGDVRENPIEAIEQGCRKARDYIIIAISSEGTVRNGCGDSIKMQLMDILKGDYVNPHVSIWHYKLDNVDEVADPSKWLKAQPNLGHSVSYETYQLEVEKAEKVPSERNDILAKRFGIPMEGFTYFFTFEETIPTNPREYWQMPCSLGCDLSQGDDFCAFTFLFPLGNGTFGVKTRCYISELTQLRLKPAMKLKYEEFLNEGSLMVMDGNVLDIDGAVYDDLENYISSLGYDVRCVGYDPYNAKEFINRWTSENGPFGIEKVIQGVKTETVPLGELKHMAEERMLMFDQLLFSFTMGNAITLEDTNGNRKLLKKRRDRKIDSISALIDAYVSFKLNKDLFD